MKKFYFLFLMIVSIPGLSQPSVKIYAYSQVISPGIVPKGVTDENGNRINTKKEPAVSYYIFASYNSPVKIAFSEVWIKGKFYNSKTKKY